MNPLDVLVLYNQPALAEDDPDYSQEAGVLDSVAAVSAALIERGHTVRSLALGPRVADVLGQLSTVAPPDVVFNLFEGLGGVGQGEGEITGLLALLGYPLTGSPAECLSLVRHKARTKWLLAGAGLPTPAFYLLEAGETIDEAKLADLLERGPAIVKPAHEDASLGIGPESVVRDVAAARRRIEALRARYGAVLVEQFVVGREFNAAILSLETTRLLPLAEIEFSGPGEAGWQIVTYDAKWAAGSEADRSTPARCPAQVDEATAERIGRLALSAFRAAGCRHYARVDMRMDAEGHVYILEINGNPDIGPDAGYARALRIAGISYEDFAEGLVRQACASKSSGKF